jgi:hypothetical protein
MRGLLFEASETARRLHFLDVPAEFDHATSFFVPWHPSEGFNAAEMTTIDARRCHRGAYSAATTARRLIWPFW